MSIVASHCERGAANQPLWIVAAGLVLTIFSLAHAQYSGGTGEPNDPYKIAMAADLIALGETPADYGKHFVLTADIDLDPNLPGRKVFDKPIIARDAYYTEEEVLAGPVFMGIFDGAGHSISHLSMVGQQDLGLFGYLGSSAQILNLRLEAVDIDGTGSLGWVGSLAACNSGSIIGCSSTGIVRGRDFVGGLVGENEEGQITASHSSATVTGDYCVGGLVAWNSGSVVGCSSTGTVKGGDCIGGLVGTNDEGEITASYSSATVSGGDGVGGLLGENSEGDTWEYENQVDQCYSTGAVSGTQMVGGLVGENDDSITNCYSTGPVNGETRVGGLVGYNGEMGGVARSYSTGRVTASGYAGGLVGRADEDADAPKRCFWDIETSGQTRSAGGTGKTTAEMQDIHIYQNAGWDLAGRSDDGLHEIWQIPEGGGYPILAGLSGPQLQGRGTPEAPFLVSSAAELGTVQRYPGYAHYRLIADIDLAGVRWGVAVIPWFAGTFDGNGHAIGHLTISGGYSLGLFGRLEPGGEVRNLAVVDVNVVGTEPVSGLVAINNGVVTRCSGTGMVHGGERVGALVGHNYGFVSQCRSAATVTAPWGVGGLVGDNTKGSIATSCSTGAVSGTYDFVGGLVGWNDQGSIATSYSSGRVSGRNCVGGLVGRHWYGHLSQCYSTGAVTGGGLVGYSDSASTTASFWDTQTSGRKHSSGGTGKTTAEMQTGKTFLDAGWDFVGETANGTEDIWWIDEGKDYPQLWWEAATE